MYIVVAVAAVFILIVIILVIMCVGLCLRQSKMEELKTPKGEFMCHVQMCAKFAMDITSISEILRINFHLKIYEINVNLLE